MKKGLLKVLSNIVVLLSILVIVDYLVGFLGDRYARWLNNRPRNSDAALVNYNLNAAVPDVAIIGSSTAICHYDPVIIHDSLLNITGEELEVFNMGMSKQKMAYNYYALKCLLERKAPKIVIEDVWASNLSASDFPKYYEEMRPYVNTNHNIYELLKSHDAYDFKMKCNMYCFNTELVKLIMASTKPQGANGYKPSTFTMDRVDKLSDKDTSGLESLSVKEFDDMIKLCKDYDVKLFVVLSPAIRSSDTTSVSYLYMKNKCEENGIPFLDYSNDKRFYQTRYFADPLHMNRYGAEFFSSILMNDLMKYLNN